MLTDEARDKYIFDLIGHGNECVAQAAQIKEAAYRQAQEVESLIPDTINALTANNFIAPGDAIKVATALKNPVSAIQLLKKVASRENVKKASALGSTYKRSEYGGMSKSASQQRVDEAEERLYNRFC